MSYLARDEILGHKKSSVITLSLIYNDVTNLKQFQLTNGSAVDGRYL